MIRERNDAFVEVERYFFGMVKNLQSASAMVKLLEELEHDLCSDVRELGRQLLQGHLDARGAGDVGKSVLSSEGLELSHRRVMELSLQTVFGPVRIRRTGYSRRGHSNLFPLDAVLNLPSCSYSYGLQRLLVKQSASNSFEEAIALMSELTGVKLGKRQGLSIVQRCAIDFDEFYHERNTVLSEKEKDSPIMVLTTDGKGVVMRTEGLRDATRKLKQGETRKIKAGTKDRNNRKRMAQVASIYTIERYKRTPRDVIDEFSRNKSSQRRPRPSGKRIWASVEKDSGAVITELFEEARRRDPQHKKEWVALVDGHRHQLRLIRDLSKSRGAGKVIIILDIVHVIEYLWTAARLFFPETSYDCEKWVGEKLGQVLKGEARKVAGSIRMSIAKKKMSKKEQEVTETSANYLATNAQYMDYINYLKKGYPIGTGVIEGACRYLVKDRMEITGARWSLAGAEAILKLRSVVKSGDFEDYWRFHLAKEFTRIHASKFADIKQIQKALKSS